MNMALNPTLFQTAEVARLEEKVQQVVDNLVSLNCLQDEDVYTVEDASIRCEFIGRGCSRIGIKAGSLKPSTAICFLTDVLKELNRYYRDTVEQIQEQQERGC